MTAGIERLESPIIYHLAAAANRNVHQPAVQFESNIRLTAALVAAGADARARGFVYAGSCTEYGPAPAGLPIPETAPLASLNLYDASKAAAGLWARAVARYAGLGFAWARLFSLYGPGLRPPRLLPVAHAALRENRAVTLGSQVRDWLYVDDAAEGMLRLGEYAAAGGHGTFNLCTGRGLSNHDIVRRFAQRMGADLGLLKVQPFPAQEGEAPWLVGDPAAAEKLGWSARTELDVGLDKTIAALDRERANGS
jgi:nucleoside-diphosphate-sugar epimerase